MGSVLWKGLRRRSCKVKLKQEGEESWEGRVGCEQKIRGARWVEVGCCACYPGLTQGGLEAAREFAKTRHTASKENAAALLVKVDPSP